MENIKEEDFIKSLEMLGFKLSSYDEFINPFVKDGIKIAQYECVGNSIITSYGYDDICAGYLSINGHIKIAYVDSHVSYSSKNYRIIYNIYRHYTENKVLSNEAKVFLEQNKF